MFRRLTRLGLPLGVALALCSVAIATTYDPLHRDEFTIAAHLMQLANLPLSLGYVGALMLFIHGGGNGLRLEWLAPTGRMALTNYLLQSAVGTLVFYGYGLGQWPGRPAESAAAGADGVRTAGRGEPVVAGAFPLRSDGMGVASDHHGSSPPLRRKALANLFSTAPDSAN